MRALLWLALGLALSCPSYAQQEPEYSYWKLYEVKSGQWLYRLSRDLKSQGLQVKSLNHLVNEILKKNPQITDKNKIEVGEKILVPFNLPNNEDVPRFPASQIVNYHVYHNSTVYHGGGPISEQAATLPIVMQNSVEMEQEQASRAPAQIQTLKDEVSEPWGINLRVNPYFGFNQLDATEIGDGSQASLASATSFGIISNIRHKLFSEIDAIYNLGFASDNFIAPVGATQTSNLNQQYFMGSLGVGYRPIVNLNTSLLVGLEQAPYLSATATEVSVAKVSHPSIRINSDYEFFTDMHLLANLGYLLGGQSSGIEVENVILFGVGAGYGWNLWNQDFLFGIHYNNQTARTQSTEQTSQAIHFVISWSINM